MPHRSRLFQRRALARVALAATFWGLGTRPGRVQGFPSRPVRLITPLSAGSQADLLARMVARQLSEAWRQPVIVENHPGGAGQVASQILVAAPPDGHTLMLHSDGHAVSAALYAGRLPYDTLRDIARVSLVASSPSVLVVGPDFAAADVAALVLLARRRPAARQRHGLPR